MWGDRNEINLDIQSLIEFPASGLGEEVGRKGGEDLTYVLPDPSQVQSSTARA